MFWLSITEEEEVSKREEKHIFFMTLRTECCSLFYAISDGPIILVKILYPMFEGFSESVMAHNNSTPIVRWLKIIQIFSIIIHVEKKFVSPCIARSSVK